MQTLRDVVKWLEAEESEVSTKTICLRSPWNADAEARVVEQDEKGGLPLNVLSDGLKYFLEISVAVEVLEVLRDRPTRSTSEDACRLLLYYAEYDAYPEWVRPRRQ